LKSRFLSGKRDFVFGAGNCIINKTMKKILLFQCLSWYFIDCPREILGAWRNFLLFGLDYFSIPLLFKTFFSHWRRAYVPYGRGFSPSRYFQTFVFNLFSRLVGVVLRTFFIVFGALIEIVIFLAGLAIFLGWLFSPILLVAVFIFSLRLIFT